jgi:hypothetical protein
MTDFVAGLNEVVSQKNNSPDYTLPKATIPASRYIALKMWI